MHLIILSLFLKSDDNFAKIHDLVTFLSNDLLHNTFGYFVKGCFVHNLSLKIKTINENPQSIFLSRAH